MAQGQYSWVFNGSIPPLVILQHSDLSSRIGGFTLINQSNCVAGVYLGRNPSGTPDVQVLGNAMVAFPCNGMNIIGVSWIPPGGLLPEGTAYAHFTSENIVSTANQITSSIGTGGVFDSAIWDQSIFG